LTSISELTFFGTPVVHLEEINSTNEYLKNVTNHTPMLVIADYQTKGRGQYGKVWESASNQNLTFSFQWQPYNLKVEEGYKISQLVSLVILETINHFIAPNRASIKWPNDIIIKNKKVCGLLIEPSIQNNLIQKVIVGIGLNVHQTHFPGNITNASSLSSLFPDKNWQINALLKKMITSFEMQLPILQNIDTRQFFNSNLLEIKEIVTLKKNNELMQYINLGVNKDGFWVLKNLSNNEILTIASSQEIEYVY
jgi:BirA family biotin operon repressor/biotin-[acetyl-CoA-carboxylase] ligase